MARHFRLRDQLAVLAVLPLLVATVAAVVLVADGSSGARPLGLVVFGALVLVAPVCVLIIRAIVGSVEAMADRVEVMADAHRRRGATTVPADNLSPLDVGDGSGPLERLAGAVNELHAAAVEAGRNQHDAVRDGLSGIVVNLARRNQTLIDRQIEQLDQLEQTEEDPNRLGHLFKVDHLATRMRRNAESLLVLADADPGYRRGDPVEVADVLRVAMGEVEMFQKIDLARVDRAKLPPAIAVDLAHLAAELMENATQFSPPTSPVVVTGTDDGVNRYLVVVTDDGMGLTPNQLAAANRTLADPPELNLDMGRSLGFMVIGRLARRLGATVTLAANGDAGCRAVVSIPKTVLVDTQLEADTGGSVGDVQAEPNPVGSTDTVPSLFESVVASAPMAPRPQTSQPSTGDSPSSVSDRAGWDRPGPPAPQIATARQIPAPPRPPNVAPDPAPKSRPQPIQAQVFAWPEPQAETPRSDRSDRSDQPESGSVESTANGAQPGDPGPPTPNAIEAWPPPVASPAPDRLEQALPTGSAFDDGMASLLDGRRDPAGPNPLPRSPMHDGQTAAGLARRRRSNNSPTVPEGRPVAANRRDPDEIRQRLSRYRQGLKGHRPADSASSPLEQRPTNPITGDEQ